jgi:hypothetical protein
MASYCLMHISLNTFRARPMKTTKPKNEQTRNQGI